MFSHGFPELAYSWRNQIPALAAAGFHVLVPDQRGYGASDKPAAVDDYDIVHLTGDLVGVLDAFDVDKAVFVGHDWGGFIVWQMPFLHPERVAGVVGVNTPHVPRMPMPPVDLFRKAMGENFYIVWFQTPDDPRGRARRRRRRGARPHAAAGDRAEPHSRSAPLRRQTHSSRRS